MFGKADTVKESLVEFPVLSCDAKVNLDMHHCARQRADAGPELKRFHVALKKRGHGEGKLEVA